MTAAPAWKDQPVPDMVRRTFPDVPSWEWLSPLRLRGEHEMPGAAYLVVVDAPRTHVMGQAIGPPAAAEDEGYVRKVYAQLRMSLMRDIGHRDACMDGTPVCREDDGRCHWCENQSAVACTAAWSADP